MALTKEVKCDKIEIVGDYKAVQCRQATVISEDGVELSRSFHRHVLHPDSDISGEPQETQDICNAVWSDEVKEDWFVFQHKYPSGDPSDSWELAQLQKYCDDNDIEHYPEAVEAVEAQDAVLDEDGEEVSPAVEAVEAQDADTKASLLAAIEEESDE
jgi:hypothetical protein